MESALPFGSYLTSLPADDALMAAGLLGSAGISLLLLAAVLAFAALVAPAGEAR